MKYIFLMFFITSLLSGQNNVISLKSDFSENNPKMLKSVLLNEEDYHNYEFFLKRRIKGLSGVIYSHYGYKYKGLTVSNREVVITIKNGKPTYLTGDFFKPDLTSPKPVISKSETLEYFIKGKKNIKFFTPLKTEILIKNNKSHLAYTALVAFNDKNGFNFGRIYFDTSNGKTIEFDSKIKDSLRREIYDFENKCFSSEAVFRQLPGTLLFYEGNENENDFDALNAYKNTGITYWFYKYMFNRDSFDNHGKKLISTVHVRFYDNFYGCHGYNASFIGYPFYQMVYGDGNPNYDGDNFSKALDVVAHELTHAVTDDTSDLIYRDESGALNEAMSDIFGATAEAWSQSGGNSEGNPEVLSDNENTWKIGEEIGDPIRYMDRPSYARQPQPNHYDLLRYIGTDTDSGGVHINSGIINLAYYLIVKGGKHPVRKQDLLKVKGLGLKKAIKIFYEAQIGLFTPYTDFEKAREYLSLAAENLYGECSFEAEQVNRAFDILGIPGTRRADCIKTCDELNCSNMENSYCFEGNSNNYCKCNEGFHFNSDETACEEDYICYEFVCDMKNSHCEAYNNEPVCICDEGYYLDGSSCVKEEENPCLNINCSEHGVCEVKNNKATCVCDAGYELSENGIECVKYVNPCQNIDCSGNGNCIVKNNEALCACREGYEAEGLSCVKKEVDPCENVDCKNGICVDENDKAICICEDGYILKNGVCEKEQVNTVNINKNEESSSCDFYGGKNYFLIFLFVLFFLVRFTKKTLS